MRWVVNCFKKKVCKNYLNYYLKINKISCYFYQIIHFSVLGFMKLPFLHFHTSLNSLELISAAVTRKYLGL